MTTRDKLKNIEVEVKLKVKDVNRVLNWLKENEAEYLGEKNQLDIYFDPPHKSFINVLDCGKKIAREYLRLRQSDKGCSVAYKSRSQMINSEEMKNQFTEIETTIEKHEKMYDLFKILGFKETAIIDKYRRSWRYGDFLFDIDDVKELGVFVEIEFQGKAISADEAERRLLDFLDSMDIGEYELDKNGLVQLYWNRHND